MPPASRAHPAPRGAAGTFFKCSFDPVKGGDCTREDWQRFLLPEEDE